jgi:hypothetical protein
MSGNALSGLGFIINTTGLLFQNASGSSITQITSSDGKLITNSALIGGWTISDSTGITKVGTDGAGTITLNSTAGTISVSNGAVSGYTAGINGGGSTALTSNVFWAGSGGASSESNGFRVTLGGTLHATGAEITGKISSTTAGTATSSAGAVISLDAVNDWISLGQSTKTAYILQRNDNLYITAPTENASPPWTGGTGYIASSGPVNGSYFAAGSRFKDSWGNDASGIGLFSGAWDYSSGGSSDPFVTLTKNNTGTGRGIQLSAAPELGMLIEKGGATSDAFTDPTLLIYTAKNATAPYSPSTTYGAYAKFQSNLINISASTNTFINVAGPTTIGGTNQVITLQASANSDGTDSPYTSPSKIVLSNSKVQIFGLTAQGNADIVERTQSSSDPHPGYRKGINGQDLYPLGSAGRQRMIVQSEYTGELLRGMAVYYQSTAEFGGNAAPSSTAGVVGDLFVVY